MPDQKRVIVCNVFPDGNKGGAAITGATIDAVREAVPGAPITLIATQVDTDRFAESHRFTMERYPDVEMRMPLAGTQRGPLAGLRTVFRSIGFLLRDPCTSRDPRVREIVDARLVVSKGGYVFVERKSIRRLLRVLPTALPLVLASRAGVRTAAIGATVGPFTTWSSRALNRWILRRLDLLVPRDEYSYGEALKLGVPADRVLFLPDLVFSHPSVTDAEAAVVAEGCGLAGLRVAAITVTDRPGYEEHARCLLGVIQRVLGDGLVDRVAVVLQATEDRKTSEEFVERCADPRVVLVDQDLSPEQLIAFYRACSFVMTRRLHASIFSILAGTPTFPVVTGTGRKTEGVMRSLGLEDFLLAYPAFDVEDTVRRVTASVESREEVRVRLETAVAGARVKLREVPLALARLVSMSPQGPG
jgi:colanic acid/amylovoran biosynthesis protein